MLAHSKTKKKGSKNVIHVSINPIRSNHKSGVFRMQLSSAIKKNPPSVTKRNLICTSSIIIHQLPSSKIIPNHYLSTSTEIDIPNTYHRDPRKKTKKQSTSSKVCIIIFLIILVLGVAIATVMIKLLVFQKQSKKSNKLNKTAILRWNTSGITIDGVTDVFGCQANQLYQPWDVALDSAYTLYITDRFNGRIQKLIRGALNATTITAPPFTFSRPSGIIIDDDDNIYIADQTLHIVSYLNQKVSSISIIAGTTGTAGNGLNQLSEPHGLSLDRSTNTLYIAEYAAHRIRSYSYGATSGTTVAGGNNQGYNIKQLKNPTAVFFDSFTNSLLIANYGANNVVRWVLGDDHWTLAAGDAQGLSGATSMLLANPIDVKLDPMGNMYVAEETNQRIQFFPYGQMNGTTIAGRTGILGTDSYTFNRPASLILDNQLNLYVVDFLNDRIQKFLRY